MKTKHFEDFAVHTLHHRGPMTTEDLHAHFRNAGNGDMADGNISDYTMHEQVLHDATVKIGDEEMKRFVKVGNLWNLNK